MNYNKFIITGAASGLGREFALRLNSLKKEIILIDKNFDELKNLKKKLGDKNTIEILNFDLSNISMIDQFVNDNLKKDKSIDCLINCAAYEAAGFFDDIPEKELLKNIDTNLIAPMLFTKKLINNLINNHGAIINIVSTMSTVGVPGRMPYCVSKAALKIFSDTLRGELKYQNVHVLTVFPEVMETPFWENVQYFGRIKIQCLMILGKKNPQKVAHEVLNALEKKKYFYWKLSMTNFFQFFTLFLLL